MRISKDPITGKEIKTEDICSLFFPFLQFHDDFNILLKNKIINRIDFDKYDWTKSKTSLAEYFFWIGKR